MEEITAVPRLPHPMIPTLTAELAFEPNTIPGFKMMAAEMAAEFLIKEILFILQWFYYKEINVNIVGIEADFLLASLYKLSTI